MNSGLPMCSVPVVIDGILRVPKGKFMLRLYSRAASGSCAVEALIAELGIAVELVDVRREADGSIPQWYMAINPRGEVPAIAFPDNDIMTESAAIMLHLADLHRSGDLAPPLNSDDRRTYLRWMVYLASAPYISDLRLFYPERYSTDKSHADGIKAKAIADLNRDFDLFADGMGEGPFVLGQKFSAVDIYAAMLISWSEDITSLFARLPKLEKLYRNVTQRPAIRKVWERNEMTLLPLLSAAQA